MARPPRSILVVNPVMPRPDRDSGSLRLNRLLGLMVEAGHDVTLIARFGLGEEACAQDLERRGIAVYRVDPARLAERHGILDVPPLDLEALLREGRFDVAFLSTHDVAAQYAPLVRYWSPLTRIVVDTVDVHFVRELRGAQLGGDAEALRKAEATKERERAAYAAADALVAVTEPDADALRELAPGVPVHVVSNVHDPEPIERPFEERSGVVFVGSFNHPPNIDAALHLCRDVWPAVRAQLPEATLHVVGTDPPPEVRSLAGDGITVTGWVPSVEPYLTDARVSIAPLRYGAGVKGKIGEALALGLPVVTTGIGGEGMSLVDGETALLADDAAGLAAAVVRAHEDAALWNHLARSGPRHVAETLGSQVARQALDGLYAAVAPTTFLAPRDLDAAGLSSLLSGYVGAFAETDEVSLVIPVADAAAGQAALPHLIQAVVAAGADPEHIPDVAVTPCAADVVVPASFAAAPSGDAPAAWRAAAERSDTDADATPAPRATLLVRPAEDVPGAERQFAALDLADVPADVEIVIALDDHPTEETEQIAALALAVDAAVLRFPAYLGRRAAIQRAAARSNADTLVVLESLVLPEPGFVEPLLAAVEAHGGLVAPVIDGEHGYRIADDGALWPLSADAGDAPDALAFDCLAARRELWLDMPTTLPAGIGHLETQLAAWASEHGGVTVARDSAVSRLTGPPATIFIATCNGGDELPGNVDLLVASGAENILIVDNASTDDTGAVAADLAARHPGIVQVAYEGRPGVVHARNAGAAHAKHELMLCLDDDARCAPGWIQRMSWTLAQDGIASVGGPIAGLWPHADARPADWLPEAYESMVSILDHGDADCWFGFGYEEMPYGANWAVRRSAILAVGGFDVAFGRSPEHHIAGEETIVSRRIARSVGKVRYLALASTGHRIAPGRISDDWLISRVITAGLEGPQMRALLDGLDPAAVRLDAERVARWLVENIGLTGDLTVEEALPAIMATPATKEERLRGVYLLGAIAASAVLIGADHITYRGLTIRARPEHATGILDDVALVPMGAS